MAVQPPATLCALFDNLQPGSSRLALEDDAAVARVVQAHIGAVRWTASAAELVPTVAKLLDIPLPHVLVAFWQKADEVARAIEVSRRSPGVVSEVSLSDCSTTATLEPYIEVRLAGVPRGKRIPVTVSLPLTFRAVRLKIADGAITAVSAGECEIGGTIKLVDLTLAKLKEPLTVTLGAWQLAAERRPSP
jgi:hypothetical protein